MRSYQSNRNGIVFGGYVLMIATTNLIQRISTASWTIPVFHIASLPDPVYFQGELYPCGEWSLDLLRPPWLQGPAVHPGAWRVPWIPEVELPQRPHGILQAHPHGKHLWQTPDTSLLAIRSHDVPWTHIQIHSKKKRILDLQHIHPPAPRLSNFPSAWRALSHRAVWGLQLLRSVCGHLWRLSLPAEPRILQELHQLRQGLWRRSVSNTSNTSFIAPAWVQVCGHREQTDSLKYVYICIYILIIINIINDNYEQFHETLPPLFSAGWCTRSQTSVVACTLWSVETTAAITSGRPRTPTSSPSAESSTTSKPCLPNSPVTFITTVIMYNK